MKATFDQHSVNMFRFTHGKLPRGTGMWAFKLSGPQGWVTVFFNGTFTQAKAVALATARQQGFNTVAVLT